MPDLPRSVDAVVVGAGLAGLAAARELTAAGMDTLVLEAGDGVGGRVRTDVVDGFRLDRGFQAFATAYPEARRVLDLERLDLRPFARGAVVVTGSGRHPVGLLPGGLRGALEVLGPADVPGPGAPARDRAAVDVLDGGLRVARLTARTALLPAARLLAAPERSTAAELRRRGLDGPLLERFWRPFLSGVFLEDELTTSSRFFAMVWRSFARGRVTLPAAGMGAIPAQLAGGLPAGTIRLGVQVSRVDVGGVETEQGPVRARTVVVAADPAAAGRLLPGMTVPALHAVTTYYHAAALGPRRTPAAVVLDGRGAARGPVATTVVLTDSAPSYSPDDRALVASSVLGRGLVPEATVRSELAVLHGVDTRGWELVGTARVLEALPAAPPPLGDLRRTVRVVPGLYVAGDHRDTPSIQGALVSGRRAARAALRDRGRASAAG